MSVGKCPESADGLVDAMTDMVDSGQMRPAKLVKYPGSLKDDPRQHVPVTPNRFVPTTWTACPHAITTSPYRA